MRHRLRGLPRSDVLTLIRNEPVSAVDRLELLVHDRLALRERDRQALEGRSAGAGHHGSAGERASPPMPRSSQNFRNAGIPMLNKPFGDIAHWKGMIFAGQNVAEFSGRELQPVPYVYEIPYVAVPGRVDLLLERDRRRPEPDAAVRRRVDEHHLHVLREPDSRVRSIRRPTRLRRSSTFLLTTATPTGSCRC